MGAIPYKKIDGPNGDADKVNMGGTLQLIYIAAVSAFLSLKKPTPDGTDFAKIVQISDTHTFKTGKCFIPVYCTEDKGMFDSEDVSETDGAGFKHTGKIFIPGLDAEAQGIVSQLTNDRIIALFPTPDGQNIQVGNHMFGAQVKGKFGTSTNSSGVRGTELTIEALAPVSMYVYTGTITLTPAA